MALVFGETVTNLVDIYRDTVTLDRMVSAGCKLEFQRSGEHSMRGYQELKKSRLDGVCRVWGMYRSGP